MKKCLAALIFVSSALLAPAVAQAQGLPKPDPQVRTYASLGYTNLWGEGINLGVLTGRVGVKSGYIGAEVEGGVGIVDDTVFGASVKVEHSIAAFAVGYLPLSNNVQLLARAGYGTTKLKASAGGYSASVSGDSFNFGGGAIVSFDEHNHLRGEYTRYDDADSVAISYVRTF